MTLPEARALESALLAGRSLASLAGVPARTLRAARALAGWMTCLEPALALALWQGCTALDDGCDAWLEVAVCALMMGRVAPAWEAAARVAVHPVATESERSRARLLLARVALLARRPDEAARWLAHITDQAPDEVRRLAKALAAIVPSARSSPSDQPRRP